MRTCNQTYMCVYLYTLVEERFLIETNSRKIIKRLEKEGFQLVSVRGSHHKFRKGSLVLIVPHPKKALPVGTARAIAKAAGWL